MKSEQWFSGKSKYFTGPELAFQHLLGQLIPDCNSGPEDPIYSWPRCEEGILCIYAQAQRHILTYN